MMMPFQNFEQDKQTRDIIKTQITLLHCFYTVIELKLRCENDLQFVFSAFSAQYKNTRDHFQIRSYVFLCFTVIIS